MKAKEAIKELVRLPRPEQYRRLCDLFQERVENTIRLRPHRGAPSISLVDGVLIEVRRWWLKVAEGLSIIGTARDLLQFFLLSREGLRYRVIGSYELDEILETRLKSTGWAELLPEGPLSVKKMDQVLEETVRVLDLAVSEGLLGDEKTIQPQTQNYSAQ